MGIDLFIAIWLFYLVPALFAVLLIALAMTAAIRYTIRRSTWELGQLLSALEHRRSQQRPIAEADEEEANEIWEAAMRE